MPVNEQDPVTVPPAVRVTDEVHVAVSWPVPVGPVIVVDNVTAPANPFVTAGLPKLTRVAVTLRVSPGLFVTVELFVEMLKPLTLIVMTPEAWAPTLGLVTWFTLNVAEPRFGAVALIDLVIV